MSASARLYCSRAEGGQARLDLLESVTLRELGERPPIGRDRVGFLAGELLRAAQAEHQLLVVEVLRAQARQRDLERVDRLGVVALRLPRVRDAALAERLERPRRPLRDGDVPGAACLRVLLRVESEAPEL